MRAGYKSVALNAESPDWLTLYLPAASVTVMWITVLAAPWARGYLELRRFRLHT